VVHVGDGSLKRLCELATGTTVTPGQLVPLIGDADIERIVYAPGSRRVIDLGVRSRLFTGPLRRAILLRDRRCRHPGCDTPAEDCEVDHVIPYSRGGRTDQDNGEARCATHNRHKSDKLPDHRSGNHGRNDGRAGCATDKRPGGDAHPDYRRQQLPLRDTG
jgi:HNH endonuclease